ncbi:hypothetical protein [Pseudomonas sp. SDO5591_S426]
MNFAPSSNSPGAATTADFFRRVALAWLLVVGAICLAVAAYAGFLKPETDQPGQWFSRSGALITVLAIFAEQVVSRMLSRMHNGIQPKVRWLVAPRAVAFALIIAGTVVWGYGDLMY